MFRTSRRDGIGNGRKMVERAAEAVVAGMEPLELRLLLSSVPHGSMLAGPPDGSDEPDLPPSAEYVLGPKWHQPGGLGSQLVLTWSYSNLLNGALGGGLSNAQLQAAIVEALQVWSAVVPLRFEQRADSGPLPTASHTQYTEGTNPRLRFGHHAIDGAGGVLAHAFYPDPTSGSTVGGLQGDTHFDSGETWRLTPGAGGFDIIEVAVHEIGHAIGLDHEPMPPTGNTAIMNPFYGGRYSGPGTAFLFQDDINGIQALYGAGLGYVLDLNGRLYISGTEGNNSFVVSYNSSAATMTVSSSGFGSFTRSVTGINSIEINGRGGNDTFWIDSLPPSRPLTINGGAGNDQVLVGWTNGGNLDQIPSTSPITFVGGAGTDAIVLYDAANTFGDTVTITSNNVNRGFFGGITYSGVSSVLINGGSGDTPWNVNSTASGTSYTINAGDGNDTLTLGASSANLTDLAGSVTFNGQGGTNNRIFLQDTNQSFNRTIGITSNSVTRNVFGGLTYSNSHQLTYNGGGGVNTFTVSSTLANTPVIINAGIGNDVLNYGTGNLDTIAGAVTFNGQDGTDSVVVNDSTGTTGRTYTITSTQVFRSGAATLTYGTVESMTLNAAGGNDTVTVNSTASTVGLTVNGGAGNDLIRLAFSSGNLNNVAGPVTVNGGAGSDTLVVYDDFQSINRSFTITSDTVNRAEFGGVTYGGITALDVRGGGGNDSFNVHSTHADTPVTITGGAGDDTLVLSRFLLGLPPLFPGFFGNLGDLPGAVTFNGGAGDDSIILHDADGTTGRTYSVTNTSVTRSGFGGLTYSNSESISLAAAGGNDTFNVISTNAQTPVTITGGAGNDTLVLSRVLLGLPPIPSFFGNLNNVAGAVNFNGGAGTDHIFLQDADGTDGRTYTITSTTLTRSGFGGLTYSNTNGITLNAAGGNDGFFVNSTHADAPLAINAGAGTDVLHISWLPENLNTIPSAIAFDGGAGNDHITVWDNQSSGSDTYTITSTSISRPSFGGLTYSNTASIVLWGQSGNNIFNVNSTHPATTLTLHGLDGVDRFNINAPPSSTVNVHGGNPGASVGDGLLVLGTPTSSGTYTPSGTTTGSGVVTVDGQNINFTGIETPWNAVRVQNFDNFRFITPNSQDVIDIVTVDGGEVNIVQGTSGGTQMARLLFRDVKHFVLDTGANDGAGGGSGNDTVTIHPLGVGAVGLETFRFIGGTGSDRLIVNDGTFTFFNDPSADTANLTVDVNGDDTGSATVRFTAPVSRIHWLHVGAGGNVVLPPGPQKVLVVHTASMSGSMEAPAGRIDLNANGMIFEPTGSTVAEIVVHSWLASGYNGGAWNGNGIASSTAASAVPAGSRAIGMGRAGALGINNFMGVPVAPIAVVLRYTYSGDANLDGQVNIADLGLLASNWQQSPRYWYQGNFNYDSIVNIADLGVLASNWQAGASFSERLIQEGEEEESILPAVVSTGQATGMVRSTLN